MSLDLTYIIGTNYRGEAQPLVVAAVHVVPECEAEVLERGRGLDRHPVVSLLVVVFRGDEGVVSGSVLVGVIVLRSSSHTLGLTNLPVSSGAQGVHSPGTGLLKTTTQLRQGWKDGNIIQFNIDCDAMRDSRDGGLGGGVGGWSQPPG